MSNSDTYPGDPIETLAIGTVIEVDGTHIIAELDTTLADLTRVYNGNIYPIGQFGSVVKIHFGRRLLYAYVCRLRMKSEFDRERGIVAPQSSQARVIEADLFGEAEWVLEDDVWRMRFDRGVATFPLPQQRVFLTPRVELTDVFGRGTRNSIQLGELVGSGGTPYFLDINELLGKHTAVLGSTGSGKSGTVSALLHAILDHGQNHSLKPWTPSIVILDPHNEYGSAFKEHSRLSTDEGSLSLPYWLLDMEETISLIIGKSEHAATSQTNILKSALTQARIEGALSIGLDPEKISVDSPVPYVLGNPSGLDQFGDRNGSRELSGLVGFINQQRPPGQDKNKHEEFARLIRKIDALVRDSRLHFLMKPWIHAEDSDPLSKVLNQFLGTGNSVRIVDFSGVPNEVAGAASSAIARLIFNAKVWQTTVERERSPVLIVCDEAHRYVPNSGEAQYAAARQAVQRIAKEGRKYGVAMMLVSQRPSEIDTTVLSQCNSWLVLRISNDADRDRVRAVLPDSLAGLSKVLSGLRQREVIVVGQAASIPARVRVRSLSKDRLPNSHDVQFIDGWCNEQPTIDDLTRLAVRWRYQTRQPSGESSNDSSAEAAPF